MGIKNYSQKEIFGMQPTNYEFREIGRAHV